MIDWIVKQFRRMFFSRPDYFFSAAPSTRVDYAAKVNGGFGSSVLQAPVKFIQRVFPEAPLLVERIDGEESEQFDDHPLLRLIARPNAYYSGSVLWKATIASWIVDGNAYWIKIRGRGLRPVELWWVPAWLIEPQFPESGDVFISHYEYRPRGVSLRIELQDVVHFRNGIDPRNSRLGLSDIHSLLREIFTDDEACNYTASLLRNMGVPGLVFAPKEKVVGKVSLDDAKATKEWLLQQFTGDKRGEPLVANSPVDVHQFAWSPAQMDLGNIRDVSEERVCAILGIPAAVIGFGTGLHQTKVGATMREMLKLAWTAGIVPMQRDLAEVVEANLLADFEPRGRWRVIFDHSQADAMQESEHERTERITKQFQAGLILQSEARRELGWGAAKVNDFYLRQRSLLEIPVGGIGMTPQEQLRTTIPKEPGVEEQKPPQRTNGEARE